MGIVSAIIALLKAVPSLERLFLKVADGVREAKAKARHEDKLTHIDNAMRDARWMRDDAGVEWSEDPDRAPTISEGGTIRARVDEIGLKESSGTGVRD